MCERCRWLTAYVSSNRALFVKRSLMHWGQTFKSLQVYWCHIRDTTNKIWFCETVAFFSRCMTTPFPLEYFELLDTEPFLWQDGPSGLSSDFKKEKKKSFEKEFLWYVNKSFCCGFERSHWNCKTFNSDMKVQGTCLIQTIRVPRWFHDWWNSFDNNQNAQLEKNGREQAFDEESRLKWADNETVFSVFCRQNRNGFNHRHFLKFSDLFVRCVSDKWKDDDNCCVFDLIRVLAEG